MVQNRFLLVASLALTTTKCRAFSPSIIISRSRPSDGLQLLVGRGHPISRLFSASSDYETRAQNFAFDTEKDILAALQTPNSIILDVRTSPEIQEHGEITCVDAKHVYTFCTPSQCPDLEADPESLLPDKEAPIVVHCASGKRAMTAKATLESKGYKNVLNAGGYVDLESMLDK